jgi:hypothetical protein
MLGCDHGDDCGSVVDGVQHAVAASPCRPTPIEFAPQWFPDAARRPQQVTGDELDHRRRYRLGQICGDGPRGRAGDLEPIPDF